MNHSDVPNFIVGVHQALAGLAAPPPDGMTLSYWAEPGGKELDDGVVTDESSPIKTRRKQMRGNKEKAAEG
ncbi:hypothetical protein NKI04_26380 [Mesorhizobium sp. M0814]|uniref:hypothetical protein n=1 Tax=Mesorhizobium sp. M0814 TaxID=2957004 RepID=UPI00333CC48C